MSSIKLLSVNIPFLRFENFFQFRRVVYPTFLHGNALNAEENFLIDPTDVSSALERSSARSDCFAGLARNAARKIATLPVISIDPHYDL